MPEVEREGTAAEVALQIFGVVVDLAGDPAAWQAWWEVGSKVVAVAVTDPGPQFEGITALVGLPHDPVTVRRVIDQVAGRTVSAIVVGEDPALALPYHVKLGGRLVTTRRAAGQTFFEIWR